MFCFAGWLVFCWFSPRLVILVQWLLLITKVRWLLC